MDIPDLTVLIQKVTRKEATELADHLLTDSGLKKLGPNAKLVDIRLAIIKRAESNKQIHRQLKDYLYERVEITATRTQEILGINVGFRKKLVDYGVLVPTSKKKNTRGKGMVCYFSYANVLRCINSQRYKEMRKKYDKNHAKNVERAEKANETKFGKIQQSIDKFEIKVKKTDPNTLYKKALLSKVTYMEINYRSRWDLPSFNDLNKAPDEDRNRWVDNYIRHNLTNYDYVDSYLEGQAFKESMYYEDLPEKFTEEIRKVYPFYKRNTYVAEYGKKDPTK